MASLRAYDQLVKATEHAGEESSERVAGQARSRLRGVFPYSLHDPILSTLGVSGKAGAVRSAVSPPMTSSMSPSVTTDAAAILGQYRVTVR